MESNDSAYFEAGQYSYSYSGLIDTAHTLDELREKLKKHNSSALGFLSYDAVRLFEEIPDRHQSNNPNQLPDMQFNFYKNIVKFDRQAQQAELTSSSASITTDLSDQEFINLVEHAKSHIINGDIFQVVLSRKFTTPYTVSPKAIYNTLKKISPAPYMFYIPTDHGVIVGASPEKLISIHNNQVEINPIAGTRAKNKPELEIETDLLGDKKEVAEHMMLVDLARNDIGASCKPGSVKIKELLKIKHFSHVSHIASTITGELREDKDALDALAAAFPAGTLSGAPKIRAMEIIDELETSRRGIYGGAIVQIDSNGNLDSCIAIRMAVLNNGIATVRTGAGIVYDSDPQSEANETRQKARGILEAIATAEKTERTFA